MQSFISVDNKKINHMAEATKLLNEKLEEINQQRKKGGTVRSLYSICMNYVRKNFDNPNIKFKIGLDNVISPSVLEDICEHEEFDGNIILDKFVDISFSNFSKNVHLTLLSIYSPIGICKSDLILSEYDQMIRLYMKIENISNIPIMDNCNFKFEKIPENFRPRNTMVALVSIKINDIYKIAELIINNDGYIYLKYQFKKNDILTISPMSADYFIS